MICSSDTVFDLSVTFDIFGVCNFWIFFGVTLTSKTTSSKHVSDKVPRGQSDRTGRPVISCFHYNPVFSIRFAVKIFRILSFN